jgi:hypothetical protein
MTKSKTQREKNCSCPIYRATKVLAFKHLEFVCHLDFDIRNLFVIWILVFGI